MLDTAPLLLYPVSDENRSLDFNNKTTYKFTFMKKTTLLLQLALALGIGHASAQIRNVDLETHLVSPADGAIIKLGESFDLEFYFKNLGPDAILAGDTLAYNFSGLGNNFLGRIIGTTKNINDTIHFKESITVSSSPASLFNFCVRGLMYSNSIAGNDPMNDEECHTINFSNGSTSVEELVLSESKPVSPINIYPNPASDQIRFNYTVKELGNVAMTITDMSGRNVMHIDLGKKNAGDNDINANVSTLVPGMYFVEINETHAKGRGKLLIQR